MKIDSRKEKSKVQNNNLHFRENIIVQRKTNSFHFKRQNNVRGGEEKESRKKKK